MHGGSSNSPPPPKDLIYHFFHDTKINIKHINRDLKPLLILHILNIHTHREIIENTRTENRFQILYSIATLWLIMS